MNMQSNLLNHYREDIVVHDEEGHSANFLDT